jgi:hypothetical protein
METSDLPSYTNATKATIVINCPTEMKFVKWRSKSHPGNVPGCRTALVYIPVSAIQVSAMPDQDGWNKTMSKLKRFPYCMTLRLSAPMESELENLAYDLRLSRAGTIRRILRRAITDARHGKTLEWPHQTECEGAFTNRACGNPGEPR